MKIKLSKIFKNKITYYVISVFIITFFLFNSLNNRFNVKNPIMPLFGKINSSVSALFKLNSKNKKNDEDEIEKLRKENLELKNQLIKNLISKREISELLELKKNMHYVENNSVEQFITTSLIYKNDGNFFTNFVIDAGKRDGIKKNSIVLDINGLLGIIYEVGDNYSKGMSILDSGISISFETLRDPSVSGIVSQSIFIENNDKTDCINGYIYDKRMNILPGDILMTSGLGLYPKGIMIGEVQNVLDEQSSLIRYIRVRPYVDFKTSDKVLVVNPRELN